MWKAQSSRQPLERPTESGSTGEIDGAKPSLGILPGLSLESVCMRRHLRDYRIKGDIEDLHFECRCLNLCGSRSVCLILHLCHLFHTGVTPLTSIACV